MTQEDKELLKVLCAMSLYGVKVQYNNEIYNIDYISPLYAEVKLDIPDNYTVGISEIKPYLRSMSSMTEEEKHNYFMTYTSINGVDIPHPYKTQDWLNAHHFDYRGLIEKGLAIAVAKDNNPYENNNQKTI